MSTPLISPLKLQGGTFYSLISPTKDITSQFGDDSKVVISNFVCLDIPNININPINGENYLQLNGIQSAVNSGIESVTDLNISLSQHFQNYILNLEQLVLANPNYLKSKKSVGERIFFKWLKETGAIRFRTANEGEKNISQSGIRFVEEDESSNYKRVVKFIGDISLNNIVEKGGVSYQESYMYIPTHSGSTPDILFKSEADSNYNVGDQFIGTTEFIEGQIASDGHPEGLSVSAYYDDDLNNSYQTSPDFVDVNNTTKSINLSSGTLDFLVSNLDGIGIDFDSFSYAKIAENPDIQSLSEFNATNIAGDFQFNTILVYYRVYDKLNPLNYETNLFGVYFLNDISQTALDGAFIERIKKFKFDKESDQLGNSWGLKLNMQITSNDKDISVESVINDYNTFSMSMFSEVSVNIQNLVDVTQEYQKRISKIENNLSSIEDSLLNLTDNFSSKSQLEELKTKFEEANIIFSNTESILDLIANLSDKVTSIVNGETNANIVLDFSKLKAGSGINIDNKDSHIIINSKVVGYNKPVISEFQELSNETVHHLSSLSNYHKLIGNDGYSLTQNYSFIIDNQSNNWKIGQTLRLSINFDLNYSLFNIDIFTYNSSGDLYKIFSLNDSNKSKIIDIICIDNNNLEFSIDLL